MFTFIFWGIFLFLIMISVCSGWGDGGQNENN